MCRFKEIENECKNNIFNFGGYRTSFSGMLKVVVSEPPFGINRTSTNGCKLGEGLKVSSTQ